MALNKVEICGVNTSKLPVLTAEKKAESSDGSKAAMNRHVNCTLKEIYVLFSA